MLLLITSDVHSDLNKLKRVLEKEKYDCHIDLGDLVAKTDQLADSILIQGNCDPIGHYHELSLTFNQEKYFFTHGHKYFVKLGLSNLIQHATLNNYQVCFYGHTHQPKSEIREQIYYLNPGSLKNGQYLIFDTNTKEATFKTIQK